MKYNLMPTILAAKPPELAQPLTESIKIAPVNPDWRTLIQAEDWVLIEQEIDKLKQDANTPFKYSYIELIP